MSLHEKFVERSKSRQKAIDGLSKIAVERDRGQGVEGVYGGIWQYVASQKGVIRNAAADRVELTNISAMRLALGSPALVAVGDDLLSEYARKRREVTSVR